MGVAQSLANEAHLIRAISILVRPLIRFMLKRGITYVRFIQIIRPLYVEIAESESAEKDKTVSDSRISVLTGIARRYVKEIRNRPKLIAPARRKATPGAKIIAEWTTNPEFTDTYGNPKRLPRHSTPGGAASFDQLAQLVSSDVHARTFLDDLKEKGLILIDKNQELELLSSAYLPDPNDQEMLEYFSDQIHDHIAASTHNLMQQDKPYYDRSAFQDDLTAKSVEILKSFCKEKSNDLLQTFYARANQLSIEDQKSDARKYRIRLGTYLFSEEIFSESTIPSPQASR